MFKWWKKWREKIARKKRERWEIENLSDDQKRKHFGKSPEDIQRDAVEILVHKVRTLEAKVEVLEHITKKRSGWRVNQDKSGETEWYIPNAIKYVSKVYTTGPENAYYFDVIIDGQKVTFSAESESEAQKHKLEILDVERVEEFDESTQQEMFSSGNDWASTEA